MASVESGETSEIVNSGPPELEALSPTGVLEGVGEGSGIETGEGTEAALNVIVTETGTWEEVYEPHYGRHFYYNSTTGESSWRHPMQEETEDSKQETTTGDDSGCIPVQQPNAAPMQTNMMNQQMMMLQSQLSQMGLQRHFSGHSQPMMMGNGGGSGHHLVPDPVSILPQRPHTQDCPFYVQHGRCAFGSTCRFNHPLDNTQMANSLATTTLNSHNYPLRPGQATCAFYMRNAKCKFGVTCKFDHPEEVVRGRANSESSDGGRYRSRRDSGQQWQQRNASAKSWQPKQSWGPNSENWTHEPDRASNQQPGNLQREAQVSAGQYSAYQMYPMGSPTHAAMNPAFMIPQPHLYGSPQQMARMMNPQTTHMMMQNQPYMPPQQHAGPDGAYPHRPGEPECKFYMRYGQCKYGSQCKYHHPYRTHQQGYYDQEESSINITADDLNDKPLADTVDPSPLLQQPVSEASAGGIVGSED